MMQEPCGCQWSALQFLLLQSAPHSLSFSLSSKCADGIANYIPGQGIYFSVVKTKHWSWYCPSPLIAMGRVISYEWVNTTVNLLVCVDYTLTQTQLLWYTVRDKNTLFQLPFRQSNHWFFFFKHKKLLFKSVVFCSFVEKYSYLLSNCLSHVAAVYLLTDLLLV